MKSRTNKTKRIDTKPNQAKQNMRNPINQKQSKSTTITKEHKEKEDYSETLSEANLKNPFIILGFNHS